MSDDPNKRVTVTVHLTPRARQLLRMLSALTGKSMQEIAEEIFEREVEKLQATENK